MRKFWEKSTNKSWESKSSFLKRFTAHEGLYFSFCYSHRYIHIQIGVMHVLVDLGLAGTWTLFFGGCGGSFLISLACPASCVFSLPPLPPVFDTFINPVNLVTLTDMLDNHTGVMPASVRTIVSTPVRPRRDSNSRQHHWHWHWSRACLIPTQTSGGVLPGPSMKVGQHHWA